MADDLHSFITGALWLKLKEDVRDLRVFNRRDLACAAYFHIRRLLLIQAGWSCRADLCLIPAANQPVPNMPCFSCIVSFVIPGASCDPHSIFKRIFSFNYKRSYNKIVATFT